MSLYLSPHTVQLFSNAIYVEQSWVFLLVTKPHLNSVGHLLLGPRPTGYQEYFYFRIIHYHWGLSWLLGHLCPRHMRVPLKTREMFIALIVWTVEMRAAAKETRSKLFSESKIKGWNGYSQFALSFADYKILVPQAINYKVGCIQRARDITTLPC